ncbi:PREDICTED: auxin-induced protein 6B-like [Nelumbo nucifera]|uniref:Auxin-responsive protein SAUR71-like n=2 Tax=Nelumbo nucifera TaxID=4432 RepID=A0A822Y485_NELNU|nr:PREDICTED: auxin-induced protein 6B-like [Nelumbo nucifera]DAD26803.1 TPA_asm: hypothetical protein HUJ06_028271 [Nelumbo nucifera]
MGKHSKRGSEKKGGMEMVKLMLQKLQKGFSPSARRFECNNYRSEFDEEEVRDTTMLPVPADVKEGHFAVFAVKGAEQKRFIIELSYLTNPEFLSLLTLAEEEFGFKQQGALVVPCRPDDLDRILGF